MKSAEDTFAMPRGKPAAAGKKAKAGSKIASKSGKKGIKVQKKIYVSPHNAMLHGILEEYIKIDSVEKKPSFWGTNVDEGGEEQKKDADDGCTKENCKRKKCSIDCVHGFCFICCYKTPMGGGYCAGHYVQRVKREREDNYIVMGMASKLGKPRFTHYEEKFTDYNQTVVIWCSSDFYRSKKHSGAIFDAIETKARRSNLNRKRGTMIVPPPLPSDKSNDFDETRKSSSSSSPSRSTRGGKSSSSSSTTTIDTIEDDVTKLNYQNLRNRIKDESLKTFRSFHEKWCKEQSANGVKKWSWK